MKFSVAALLSAVGFANAKNARTLRKAVPANRDGSVRKLENNQFEIDSSYSIVYNTCVSLKVVDDDLFEEGMYEMAQSGDVVAEQSYILFNAVQTEYMYYDAGEDDSLYMLPVVDWFGAVSNDDQNDDDEDQEYCEACAQSYDICYPQEEAAEYDGQQEGEGDNAEGDNQNGDNQDGDNQDGDNQDGNNRRRKLKSKKLTPAMRAKRDAMAHIMGRRKLEQGGACQISVDCDTCESKGCFEDGDNNQDQQYDDAYYCDQDNYVDGCVLSNDDVREFMQNAACVQTGQVHYDNYGNEYELRAGFICDPDGYGIQIAMFLDEDCSVYHQNLNFKNMMKGTYTYALFEAAKEEIQKPYQQAIDCLECQYVALVDENAEYDGNNNQDAQEAQLNQVCENVMQEALDIATCGGAEKEYDENQNQDENQNDDGVDKSWYTADIENADGGEIEAEDVCFFIQEHINELSNYRLSQSNQDKNGGGGRFFDYSKNGANGGKFAKAGKVVGIIVGIAVVIVAGVFIGQSFAKKDSKKVPLVGNKNGAMA